MTATLIVLAGPPCSGKSTAARELAQRLDAPHLSMDATRRRILPGAAHTRADREVAYRAMHYAAELLLQSGRRVILDAPYGHPEDRDEVQAIVEAAKGRLALVEFRITPEVASRRFLARGPDPECPDLTEDVVAQAAREYRYSGQGLHIDADQLAGPETVARIVEFIQDRERI